MTRRRCREPEFQLVTGSFYQVAVAQGVRCGISRLSIHTREPRSFDMREKVSLRTPGNDDEPIAGNAEGGHYAIQTNVFANAMLARSGQYLDASLRRPRLGRAYGGCGGNWRTLNGGSMAGECCNQHGAVEIEVARRARIQVAQMVGAEFDDIAMLEDFPHERPAVDQGAVAAPHVLGNLILADADDAHVLAAEQRVVDHDVVACVTPDADAFLVDEALLQHRAVQA